MGWTKNAAGVKDGADCYRNIGGIRWSWFSEDADWLRQHVPGIKCRRMPDGQGAFVHPDFYDAVFAALNPADAEGGQDA